MTRGVMAEKAQSNGQRGTASRRGAARRVREKAQRRDDILRAAKDIFFTRGFHAATVDEVAVEAEVSKGTVYLYFDTKETLLAHLLLAGLDALVADLEAAYAIDQPLDANTRLRQIVVAYLKFFQTSPDYYRLIMAFDRGQFQATIDPGVYQDVLARSLHGLEWVERAVKQAQAEGVITIENTREAASVLWAGLNGVLVLLSHPLRAQIIATDLESLYCTMTEVLISGLRK
ncbi:putative HTH-type transcriptional regulator YfiR [Anaerolineae bacterium]|nr:putative HTH-type transcriptional regulator YfiR [Anaerolineae bacterium]